MAAAEAADKGVNSGASRWFAVHRAALSGAGSTAVGEWRAPAHQVALTSGTTYRDAIVRR